MGPPSQTWMQCHWLLQVEWELCPFIQVKDGKRFDIMNIRIDPQTIIICIAAGAQPGL